MKAAIGTLMVLGLGLGGGAGIWRKLQTPNPPASPTRKVETQTVGTQPVGTQPGGVRHGETRLQPAPGDSLVGFSSGCFWGSEEAYRKLPGIVATAVGFSGGSLPNPTYEQAHQTGHLETVLVEFDPRKTPFKKLLETFWTLPRSKSTGDREAVWTYDAGQQAAAETSRKAMEQKLGHKLGLRVQAAPPFYLAEDYHQQFDEKSGKELCNVLP